MANNTDSYVCIELLKKFFFFFLNKYMNSINIIFFYFVIFFFFFVSSEVFIMEKMMQVCVTNVSYCLSLMSSILIC